MILELVISLLEAPAPSLAEGAMQGRDEVMIVDRSPTPAPGSGVFKILVRVTGERDDGSREKYYFLSMSRSAVYPDTGKSCAIDWKLDTALDGFVWDAEGERPPEGRKRVTAYSCAVD